jgi:hypothetical protein
MIRRSLDFAGTATLGDGLVAGTVDGIPGA